MTLYRAPTSALDTSPPNGEWGAVQSPDLPQWSLVLVRRWFDPFADETWEAVPGVLPLYPENFSQPVPLAAVNAFGSWGVVGTDTIRQALRKIRRHWPGFET